MSVANEVGIWSLEPDGSVHLLVRSFDPAPGLPNGVVVATPRTPRASGGRVLFFSGLQGGGFQAASDPALWLAPGSGGEPLPLTYSEAPLAGLPTGVVPWGFGDWSLGSGLLGFTAYLEGPGVDTSNDRAWVSMDTSGEVLMIVRSGAPLELGAEPAAVVTGGRLLVAGEGQQEVVVASLSLDDGGDVVARLRPGVAAVPVPGLQPWGLVGGIGLLALAGSLSWRASRDTPVRGADSPPGGPGSERVRTRRG